MPGRFVDLYDERYHPQFPGGVPGAQRFAVGGGSPPNGGAGGELRNTLIDQFPDAEVYSGGFTSIAVPSGYTVPSGQTALYGLASVESDKDTDGEFGLMAVRGHTIATDNTAANASAWGTANGLGAFVLVGRNLGTTPGQWVNMTTAIPSLGGETDTGQRSGFRSKIVAMVAFPPGSQASGSEAAFIGAQSFSPSAPRFRSGDRLEIALAVIGSQIQAAADDTIQGFAQVDCVVGVSRSEGYRN